jgi:hypothetical protein
MTARPTVACQCDPDPVQIERFVRAIFRHHDGHGFVQLRAFEDCKGGRPYPRNGFRIANP